MKTQKALYLKEKKGSFAIGTQEIQKPEPGEILVKIKATGLNPADWMIQTLGVVIEDYPAILGLDIAGDVEEVGEGVTGFVKGERVFLCGTWKNDFGGFQQYTRCPAKIITPK
ncbi:hypothetical protein MPER_04089 [Moniliophthora perniciosa FA553]|nr:hypothetical protein MPER_04089 [Moniliophthora perniciosa FA553]